MLLALAQAAPALQPGEAAGLLQKADRVLDNPPYNLVIHSSPVQDPTNDHYHWHMEFMPKLTKTAGFEWGSGFYINPTSPEEAAKFLREIEIR